MSQDDPISVPPVSEGRSRTFPDPRILLNILLLLLTFFTTTVAGVQWIGYNPFELQNFFYGIEYSVAILFILGCHEFGHYFAARYHGVEATLPYYIPAPSVPGFLNFGTFGAVIRTKSVIPSKKVLFDIVLVLRQ